MADLCIQIHPARAPELDMEAVREACTTVAGLDFVTRAQESAGWDGHPFVNVLFATDDPRRLWAALKETLFDDPGLGPGLAKSAMTICEGPNGWDDYLLLSHYDPAVPLGGFGGR